MKKITNKASEFFQKYSKDRLIIGILILWAVSIGATNMSIDSQASINNRFNKVKHSNIGKSTGALKPIHVSAPKLDSDSLGLQLKKLKYMISGKSFKKVTPKVKQGKKSETKKISKNTVTDIDGNVYPTVTIGTQTWMAENLNTTHAPKGSKITRYCYDDKIGCGQGYGGFYTWNTAMNDSTKDGAQGICPDGWHVPSDEEWTTLENKVGLSAGDKLKKFGLCKERSFCGTSGFKSILSGAHQVGLSSYSRNILARFWSSSESDGSAWNRYHTSEYAGSNRNKISKEYAFSVRCIKNKNDLKEIANQIQDSSVMELATRVTMKSYEKKARDSKTRSNVNMISTMIRTDAAYEWNDGRFQKSAKEQKEGMYLSQGTNSCILIMSGRGKRTDIGDDDEFAVVGWLESRSNQTVSGTTKSKNVVEEMNLKEEDFNCDNTAWKTITKNQLLLNTLGNSPTFVRTNNKGQVCDMNTNCYEIED